MVFVNDGLDHLDVAVEVTLQLFGARLVLLECLQPALQGGHVVVYVEDPVEV